MLDSAKAFMQKGIWSCRAASLSPARALWIRILRVVSLSFRMFVKNKCQLRASALTFFTLLSIVPVAALLFGIAKGYGFEKMLEEKLRASLAGHEAVADKVIAFSCSMLDNAKGGMIAGIGVLILLWTVIRLLSHIEGAFNDIWGVGKGRSFLRKLSDYLSIALICPFLIIVSGSATVFAASQAVGLAHMLPFSDAINTLIGVAMKALPLVMTWFVFAFLYVFMPHAKVKLRSALIAGIVAGTLYCLLQEVYVFTQIGVAKYNAIYGSFAALPLFLIWLQISWMIALFGAELSYAIQNAHVYELDPGEGGMSFERRRIYILELARQAAIDLESGRPPQSDEELAHLLEMPVLAARAALGDLVAAGVLAEIVRPDGVHAFLPAMPTERMTPMKVLSAVEAAGGDKSVRAGKMAMTLEALKKASEAAVTNRPLSKI